MSSGGEKNIFGTLYELLVFRDMALEEANLGEAILNVQKKPELDEIEVLVATGQTVLEKLKQYVGTSPTIASQRGDADFVAEGADGIALIQLKASMQPSVNAFDKSDFTKILVSATNHLGSIQQASGPKPLDTFVLLTNRPLGNIKGIEQELGALKLDNNPIEQLKCPDVLGKSPGDRKSQQDVDTTIFEWLASLVPGELTKEQLPLATELLVRFKYFYLAPETCKAAFEKAMKRLGLDSSETDDLGNQLLGMFFTQEHDVTTAAMTLKKAIFDPIDRFHTLCSKELRQIERSEWRSIWQRSRFHHSDFDDQLSIPITSRSDELNHAIGKVHSDQEKRGILFSGTGGAGKSYCLLSLIQAMRDQSDFLFVPCSAIGVSREWLKAPAELLFNGYRKPRDYPRWIERLQWAQEACNEKAQLWLYMPDSDELEPSDLKWLMGAITSYSKPNFKIVFIARSRIWDNATSKRYSEEFEEVQFDRFRPRDIGNWLARFRLDEFGNDLSNTSPPANEKDHLSNERALRLTHPLLFSALGRLLNPLELNIRMSTLEAYLTGDNKVETSFWNTCTDLIVWRLHKHMGLHNEDPSAMRETIRILYRNRDNLSLYDRDQFNANFLLAVAFENRNKMRLQLLQLGIIKENDVNGINVRWALEDYCPSDEAVN